MQRLNLCIRIDSQARYSQILKFYNMLSTKHFLKMPYKKLGGYTKNAH